MSSQPIHPTPARYKVLADAYIDDVRYAASTDKVAVFVDYHGHPGTALEPVDDEGRRRQAAYFKSRKKTAERAVTEKRRLTQGAFDAVVPTPSPASAA